MTVPTKFKFSSVNINNDNTPYKMHGDDNLAMLNN